MITGNYNAVPILLSSDTIISYHNHEVEGISEFTIISYQVITGNYNTHVPFITISIIISYQVITGNYNQCHF